MPFVSYAQNGEDVLLNRVFAGVDDGFYVDIGAYDPVEGSVTKAFSDRGWTGINIEPGAIFDQLAAARPRDINLRMAVLDRAGTVPFVQHESDAGMSHVAPDTEPSADGAAAEVACDTLTAILAAHAPERAIDFLKIDAEGAEDAIVGSTDWRAVRPTVLVIEATRPWSNELANAGWHPVLVAQGYRQAWFDGINCFYVPAEREDLLRHFALPINVLDHWTKFDHGRAALEAQRDALDSDLLAARNELGQARGDAEAAVRAREASEAMRAELASELATAQSQAAELASLLSDRSAELATAQSQAAELASLLSDRSAELATAQSQAAELASLLSDRSAELAAARSRGGELASLLSDRSAELAAARSRGTELASLLSDRSAELAAERGRGERLAARAALLHRLMRELRWPDGPRALRTVLPLARLVRRVARTPVPAMLPEEVDLAGAVPGGGGTALAPRPEGAPPAATATAKQRLALALYRPVRPVLRPAAWRIRVFLTGDMRAELARLEAKLDRQVAEQRGSGAKFDGQTGIEAKLDELSAEHRELARMLETTLLTLALERRRDAG